GRADAHEPRVPVAVADDHLLAAVDDGGAVADFGYGRGDGCGVARCERAAAAPASTHAAGVEAAGHDPDEVLAERIELRLDGGPAAGTERHRRHHGRDSDTDAKRGERTPHAVARQGANRHPDHVQQHSLDLLPSTLTCPVGRSATRGSIAGQNGGGEHVYWCPDGMFMKARSC